MRSNIVLLIVLLFALAAPSCTAARDPTLSLTVDSYPRVDGSTSAHPLAMHVACRLLGQPCQWVVGWDGTRRLLPDDARSDEAGAAAYLREHVVHHGTHQAYVNLIAGGADLILVARLPSEDELALARDRGVELEARAVALDAFVLILNRHNPVDSLTIAQVQAIYTGKLTDWRQVGGPAGPIVPYQRNDNSGSQELMRSLVMGDLDMVDAPELLLLYNMMGPINALSEDPQGISYSVYFYEQFMAPNEEIKLCAVEGVMPTEETIRARTYPLTTEVYVVVRADLAPESAAYRLRDWLLSAEGQAVVAESGYVPAEVVP